MSFDLTEVNFGSNVSLFGTLIISGVDARWFQEGVESGIPFVDLVSVNPAKNGFVRAVVVDPVASYSPLPAIIPAYSVLGALSAMGVSAEAFAVANSLVFDGVSRFDGSASFAASVCEWNPVSGVLRAGRAADCEVWVLRDGMWASIFPGNMLSTSGRKSWETWKNSVPDASELLGHFAAHDRVLGDTTCWNTAPLGKFPTPLVEFAELDRVDAVLITTDGLRADVDSAGDISEMIKRLHPPHASSNDDYKHTHGDIGFVSLSKASLAKL